MLIPALRCENIEKHFFSILEIPKKVQELYALINYGEMRKKIPSDNQKFYMKLRDLVYRGSVTWRSKGKNCRIKTPSCPALRKINQVESELCGSFIPIILNFIFPSKFSILKLTNNF